MYTNAFLLILRGLHSLENYDLANDVVVTSAQRRGQILAIIFIFLFKPNENCEYHVADETE